jgi:hypothetical protein
MSLAPRYALVLVSVGALSVAVAPTASADPALPEPGQENAADTINDLQSRGYDVQINWDNGVPDVDLNQCWVNSIDYADANAGGLRTVYVDIDCPK